MNFDVQSELQIIKKKLEEKHIDPNCCLLRNYSDLSVPPSLSGMYLHLPGPNSGIFRQRVVVSIVLERVHVMYAFCKSLKPPPSLTPEVLNFVAQVNEALDDCVLLFDPRRKFSMYLKVAFLVDPDCPEQAFGSLFWNELSRVTSAFQDSLHQFARFIARFEHPLRLFPSEAIRRIKGTEVRKIRSEGPAPDGKMRDEIVQNGFEGDPSFYKADEYWKGMEMGALQLVTKAYESYLRLRKKGIELTHPLASFLFSDALERQVALLPCEFSLVTSSSEDFVSFSTFLGPDSSQSIDSPALLNVLLLSKLVFMKDLVLKSHTPEVKCTSLSSQKSFTLYPVLSLHESLHQITLAYYHLLKAYPHLEDIESTVGDLAVFPDSMSADVWKQLGEEIRGKLQTAVWLLVDERFGSIEEIMRRVQESSREKFLQLILPKIVSELLRLRQVGIVHLRLNPRTVLVNQDNMEIRLVGHVLSRELLTQDVDIGDMSFVAPEVLTFISLSGKGSLTIEEQAVKSQQFQQISSNSDVFSLSVLLHSLLFPDEVLRYKTIEEQVSAYHDDLRRPFVPNEFERENPEFIDLLRRGWEEQYRPELSEFVWSRVKPAGRKDQ